MGAMTLTATRAGGRTSRGSSVSCAIPDTHRGARRSRGRSQESLQGLEDVIRYEGPQTIAPSSSRRSSGTNGILIPPDGYIQGVREICDRHGS
jgi:taurine--2-oxoglutarate transaminase